MADAVCGVMLAGGANRRMGRDKASLEFDGRRCCRRTRRRGSGSGGSTWDAMNLPYASAAWLAQGSQRDGQ